MLSTEHLGEDASDGPHVDSRRVSAEREHELGRSIPARCDVLRHKVGVFVGGCRDTARHAEIANFQIAIGVNEQIRRFQIAMQNAGRVNVLDAAQYLIEKVAYVLVGERLIGMDDVMKIALH